MPNKLVDTALQQPEIAEAPQAPAGNAPPAQKQVTLQQVKDAISKQSAIDHTLRNLLKDGKPVDRKDVINACVRLVAQGTTSAEQMAGYLMSLPQEAVQVRDWVEGHAKTVESNLDQMIAMLHGQEPPEEGQMPEAAAPGAAEQGMTV